MQCMVYEIAHLVCFSFNIDIYFLIFIDSTVDLIFTKFHKEQDNVRIRQVLEQIENELGGYDISCLRHRIAADLV